MYYAVTDAIGVWQHEKKKYKPFLKGGLSGVEAESFDFGYS